MFENIRKCLDEYEKAEKECIEKNFDTNLESYEIVSFFNMNFAKAIMKDLEFNCFDENVAKIILAARGLSNDIKVKVE
jgi:hypothetical protein